MKKHLTYYFILICLFLGKTSLLAQSYSEAEIKAAFVCNFAKFSQWPSTKFKTDTSSIIIGLVGEEPFGEIIYKIAKSAQVNDRKILVKKIENLSQLSEIHLLYIGKVDAATLTNFLGLSPKNSVLTISELKNFCQMGGIINFSKDKAKYGFEINDKIAQKSKITISAKLLKLATVIE